MTRPPAALAVAAALALVGCGGDEEPPADPVAAGEERAGSVVQLADCGDWREASVDERYATLDQVRADARRGGGPDEGPQPSDEQVYELLERACAPDYATSFRLYKVYSRGAPFIEPPR